MELSLKHVGLLARDPEALQKWYVNTLGATVAFANNSKPLASIARWHGGQKAADLEQPVVTECFPLS